MKGKKVFIDTNILIYLVKDTSGKAEVVASRIVEDSYLYISTQVINEFCNITLKKLNFSLENILFAIDEFSKHFIIHNVTISTITKALEIKNKYRFSYYDSAIIAAALQKKCEVLYTEDMHHGQVIEDSLTIINPFK
jgi:predicted nucleic acid-binding protein